MVTKDKVKAFMEQHKMLQMGDHVLIGLSGGGDSVCLFHLLLELRKEYQLTLSAVHVEHGIRGQEALRDAEFAQKLCKAEGVSCYVRHVKVLEEAQKEGLSEEEMGRKLRYEIFQQISEEIGANKIAVAHHGNDLCETMLFHLCRGTGLAGLCALGPVRENIIRPLLAFDRSEIEEFLRTEQLEYCEDSTNEDTDYTRNYIRNEIVPRLEQVNVRAVEHMRQTAEILSKARTFLEKEITRKKEQYVRMEDGTAFVAEELFQKEDEYVTDGVLHDVMEDVAGSRKDIHHQHVKSVVELFSMQVGRRISLPYGMEAVREYRGISVGKSLQRAVIQEDRATHMLQIPGRTLLGDGREVITRVFDAEELDGMDKIPDNVCTKWFDYDIINGYISIRHRRAGDYMVVDAKGGTKKIKDFLINEKVPKEQRDRLLMVTKEDLVLWVVGLRMGEFGKLHKETKKVLEITICGGIDHE